MPCTHVWLLVAPDARIASGRYCPFCQRLEIVARGYIEWIDTTVQLGCQPGAKESHEPRKQR